MTTPTATQPRTNRATYPTSEGHREVVICESAVDGDLVVVDCEGARHGFLVDRVPTLDEAAAVLAGYVTDAAAADGPLVRQLVTAFDLGLASLDPDAPPLDDIDDDATDDAGPLSDAVWTADRQLGLLHPDCVRDDDEVLGREHGDWEDTRCGRCAGLMRRPARLAGRRAGRRGVLGRRRPADERFHPLPHQEEALQALAQALPDDRGRAQILMACGTGKTITALHAGIAAAGPDDAIVVFVPSLALLAQTLEAWKQHSPYDFHYLAVCSDETVAPEEVDVDALTQMAPVTGDPRTVAEFLASPTGTRRLLLCTYHSSQLVIAAQQHYGAPAPAIALADEAHRAAGAEGGAFSLIVDRLQADAIVFFTATQHPRMRDAQRFGEVAYRLTFGQAIERGLLCDYRIVVGLCRDPELAKAARDQQLAELGVHVTDAATAGIQVALLKTMNRYKATRALTFHSRIDRAQAFAETLPDVDEIVGQPRPARPMRAHHVSGRMSHNVRAQRLSELADGDDRHVLSCARVLGEGVDVPAVDLVALIDPRESPIDIVQIVGRALRTAPGKTVATVFVAALVDPDDDIDPARISLDIADGPFATVAATLRALASADERLATRLTEALLPRGERDHSGPSGEHAGPDLALPIGARFARAFASHVLEGLVDPWEHRLLLLRAFAARTGHTNIPSGHQEFGVRLDTWVRAQRSERRAGRLSTTRQEALDALPGWHWGKATSSESWERYYEALLHHVDEHSTAYVPVKHVVGDLRLGWWCNAQRVHFRTGKLSARRAAQLEALPGWVWDAPGDPWVTALTALQAYAVREGHATVPADHVEGDVALGSWVTEQQALHAGGQLHAQRIARLEAVDGWSWQAPAATWWSRMTIYVPRALAGDPDAAARLARAQINRPDAGLAAKPRRCALGPDGQERADTRGRPRHSGEGPTAVWRVDLSVRAQPVAEQVAS